MNFASDNTTGASPEILEALIKANSGSTMPYGNDQYTTLATQMIQELFEKEAQVFFVSTGTAANSIAISTLSRSYGSVLCHWNSHIYEDECGAPEFFTGGAKLVPLKGKLAKIDLKDLQRHGIRGRGDVHMVQPSVVSITQTTEIGTVYTISEVTEIGAFCKENGLKFHMDGARFANAIATLKCSPAEVTWKAGVDVLSFGASKNGALAAEAVIFFDNSMKKEFEFRRKRGGHLFSKMRFLACQIEAYLKNDLWLSNAHHANNAAFLLKDGLDKVNSIQFPNPVESNMLFPHVPENIKNALCDSGFQFYDDRWDPGVLRLVTAFNTKLEDVKSFVSCALKSEGLPE